MTLGPAQQARFRAAFDAHGAQVYAFLVRLCGDRGQAQDLFQDTWTACAQALVRLDPEAPLLPWLLTVARNRWRMARRWAWVDVSRWLVTEPDVRVEDGAPGPEAAALAAEAGRRLEAALSRVTAAEREVLLVSLEDELSPAERAAVLGVSEAAYRQRLHRARKALGEHLGEEEEP